MGIDERAMRLIVHYGWWIYVAAVALASVHLGRPVQLGSRDWATAFNIEVMVASAAVVSAIIFGKHWVDLYVILAGFHFCLRLGVLIVDESTNPLPPKSRALAALLYGGYAVSLLATRFTFKLMEGDQAR
ncbi:MAG: hypothetical protein ACPHCN_18810 [Mycobacterium sp.]